MSTIKCNVPALPNVPALIKDELILSNKGCGKNSFYRVIIVSIQYMACQESVNIDALAINLFTDFIGSWNTIIDSSNKLLFYALVKGSFGWNFVYGY